MQDHAAASENSTTMLSATDTALARHHTYSLFGQLFLRGIDSVLRPYLTVIEEFGQLDLTEDGLREAAANHYQLFGYSLFPYASMFVDESGLLGGAATDHVVQQYQRAGFQVDKSAASPDHIGHELNFLAFLCQAEANTRNEKKELAVLHLQALQREFLQTHLLHWLPAFIVALRNQRVSPYDTLADLTLSLVYSHFTTLEVGPVAASSELLLPESTDVLENDKSGLKEIAAYLVTPPCSGIYAGRNSVGELARGLGLPRGFGSRQQMMLNLMRSAVQYNQLPILLLRIQDLVSSWSVEYKEMAAAYPALAPYIHPWRKLAGATGSMLVRMERESEHLA